MFTSNGLNVKIHIITPLSRMLNIKSLAENINRECSIHDGIVWWIIKDLSLKDYYIDKTDIICPVFIVQNDDPVNKGGHGSRNIALDLMIKSNIPGTDWIYNLDDDNMLHPNLINLINKAQQDKFSGILTTQSFKNGNVRLLASNSNVRPFHVDMAMMACEFSLTKEIRLNKNDYCSDGYYISTIYNNNPAMFKIYSEIGCYYNYLR
ncbi:MAG: hypothetical protein ACRDE2_00200 [Chitinophagaceae bacterium]